jgi:hypothetical protein
VGSRVVAALNRIVAQEQFVGSPIESVVQVLGDDKFTEAVTEAVRESIHRRKELDDALENLDPEVKEDILRVDVSESERAAIVETLLDRLVDIKIEKNPVFKRAPISERIRPKIKEAVAGALSDARKRKLGRRETLVNLYEALVEVGGIEMYPGYCLRLVRAVDGDDRDTVDQRFFWRVEWSVRETEKVDFAWDSTPLIQKLPDDLRKMFFEEVDKHISKRWIKVKVVPGRRGKTMRITTFPHVNVGKNTKVRPVNDVTRGNRISPPASNSQLSTVEAVRALRGLLKRLFVVKQRDLDQAFMRIRVRVTDTSGEEVELELCPSGNSYSSDRLVFGLAIGPLALTTVLAATTELVESVISEKARSVRQISVMDDFLFIGEFDAVEEYERAMLEAWSLAGFDATKQWTWNCDEWTKWLGHLWKWDKDREILLLQRTEVRGNVFDVTKRGTYEFAGAVHAVSESFEESMALGHANTARKLAGKSKEWDSRVDTELAKAIVFHLSEMQRWWRLAFEEEVPLTACLKILVCETDASLSGQAFVMKDRATGKIVSSESKLANDAMNLERWACNRREMHALFTAARKLAERLECFPSLKYVLFLTDSRVAEAQAGEFKNPNTDSVEAIALVRLASGFNSILRDLGGRGVPVEVSHIAGANNAKADLLSRIAETGGFKEVVFRKSSPSSDKACVQVNRISVVADRVHLPTTDFLGMPSVGTKLRLLVVWKKMRHEVMESCDELILRALQLIQRGDSKVNQAIIACKQGKKSNQFEVHNGVLVFRPPVVEVCSRANLSGEIFKVVLPKSLLKEYAAAVHVQMGHVGQKTLIAKVRKSVHCLDDGAIPAAVNAVCQECEGCSMTKPGVDHRSDMGPITLPWRNGQVIGVDITLGSADPRAEKLRLESWTFSRTPFVLSVTCKRTAYTWLLAMLNSTFESVEKAFCFALSAMGIRDSVQEVWTDHGKQFESARFKAMLDSVLPGVRHRQIPPYAPYAGGWYEAQHRTFNQVLRAVLAETKIEDWQQVCDLAMKKINCSSADDGPSPYLLWFGREPEVLADRMISVVFQPRSEQGDRSLVIENSGRSRRNVMAEEVGRRQKLLDNLDLIWEEKFIKERERAARSFRSKPLAVGDAVRTIEQRSGKLDPMWSENIKRVREVRNNKILLEGDSREYHARQVKAVAAEASSEEEGGDEEMSEAVEEAVEADDADGVAEAALDGTRRAKRPRQETKVQLTREQLAMISLQRAREGKRTVRPSLKAREAGEEGEGTDVVPKYTSLAGDDR